MQVLFFLGVLGSRASTEKSSYLFLKKEIPVRLANIIKEISYLPPRLLKMPSIDLVRSWLVFRRLLLAEFDTFSFLNCRAES